MNRHERRKAQTLYRLMAKAALRAGVIGPHPLHTDKVLIWHGYRARKLGKITRAQAHLLGATRAK